MMSPLFGSFWKYKFDISWQGPILSYPGIITQWLQWSRAGRDGLTFEERPNFIMYFWAETVRRVNYVAKASEFVGFSAADDSIILQSGRNLYTGGGGTDRVSTERFNLSQLSFGLSMTSNLEIRGPRLYTTVHDFEVLTTRNQFLRFAPPLTEDRRIVSGAAPLTPARGTVGYVVLGDNTRGGRIVGSRGNDILVGGAANDTLIGGSGSDILAPGIGSNRVDGGPDRDMAILLGQSRSARFAMTSTGELRVVSDWGKHTLVGVETIRFDDRTVAVVSTSEDEVLWPANDTSAPEGVVVTGTSRAENLTGSIYDDWLLVGEGDHAQGGQGRDVFVFNRSVRRATVTNDETDILDLRAFGWLAFAGDLFDPNSACYAFTPREWTSILVLDVAFMDAGRMQHLQVEMYGGTDCRVLVGSTVLS